MRVRRRAAAQPGERSASRRGDRDRHAGALAGLFGVRRDEPASRDVSGDGRSRPHARHGLRAADPQDRLADSARSADADVVCDLAEGGAGAGSRLPDEPDPGEYWLAGPEGDRPREASDQVCDGGAEAGRNAEDSAVQEPGIALHHLHAVQARRGRADAHAATARIQRAGDPRRQGAARARLRAARVQIGACDDHGGDRCGVARAGREGHPRGDQLRLPVLRGGLYSSCGTRGTEDGGRVQRGNGGVVLHGHVGEGYTRRERGKAVSG